MKTGEIIFAIIATLLLITALIITEYNKEQRTHTIIEACKLGERPWETNTHNTSGLSLPNNIDSYDEKNS